MTTLSRISHKSRYALLFFCLAISLIVMTMPLSQTRSRAQVQRGQSAGEANDAGIVISAQGPRKGSMSAAAIRPNATASIGTEAEPNDTSGTATPLGTTPVRVRGDLYTFPVPPLGDVDYYSFTAGAGDKVYAATMSGFSGGSSDTNLDILDTNGSSVLESDSDDGSFSSLASVVAGRTLPAAGTYFVRVRQVSLLLSGTVRPYDLYVRVLSGTPTAEIESNNIGTPQPLAANGWMSGAIGVAADTDTYSFAANAGDTIVLMVDADPERDGPGVAFWNPQAFIGIFNSNYLGVDDTSTTSVTDPPAEAVFMTTKTTGAHEVLVVASAGSGATFTYNISVSVIPANVRTCTTYSGGSAGAITDNATTDFTLAIPDNRLVNNLQLALSATHAATADLDVSLIAPDGNEVVLFDDPPTGAGAGAPQIDFILDDEAAIPEANFTIHRGMKMMPEFYARLGYFKGQQAQGTWTLRVRDDTAGNLGTVNSWGLTMCNDTFQYCTLPETPVLAAQDFEASDGGFTHSGTQDEWARGLPSGASAPITSCHSGVNCWKTDLTDTYNAGSNQDLLSPSINLTTFVAGTPIRLRWWQKYQIENASFDTSYVEVREVGNAANFKRVWEWKGADPIRNVGPGSATIINMSAGWGQMEADLSSFAGLNVEIRFHLESDGTVQRSGLAIDDVSVSACLAPTAADSVVRGRITDASGLPVAGAVVNLSGTQNRKGITDANGDYRFENVETNGFYSVTPSLVNYHFSPELRSFSQLGNNTEALFTASRDAVAGVNAIDTPEYFVRQHYLDFLGREPDESGFNFWSDQMLECGADAGCLERRRINVSAAYFLSIEFQQTGGLVDGLYRASYGRAPRYAEFMPDARTIADNIVVGAPDWEAHLRANKQAFIEGWLQRSAFRDAYDSLSNTSFVDTLISHTGVSYMQSERDALVSGLASGALSRAAALLLIVEDERFMSAKRNETFVMMEYFGYLRRDPDEGGYAFWLNKLNQFDGNFEQAEMVKAFINSGEYRARFR